MQPSQTAFTELQLFLLTLVKRVMYNSSPSGLSNLLQSVCSSRLETEPEAEQSLPEEDGTTSW
jgi:hypothetical protein